MPIEEKTERNKAIVALFICGFPQRAISRVLKEDWRNTQSFIKKYVPRYSGEIMENISSYITNKGRRNNKKSQ